MLRKMLNENLRNLLAGHKDIALSFSGGTDSTALLYSLMEIGNIPHLYTYCIKNYTSPDLKRSQWISEQYHLDLTVCDIPTYPESIYQDIRTLIKMGISGKVNIQCMHGHLYVAPAVNEKIIVNGSGVDALYGSYKEFFLSDAKTDKNYFDTLRIKHLKNDNDDAMIYQHNLFSKYGIKVIYPYRQNNIIKYLMSLDYQQINKPKAKQIILNDYPELLSIKHYWRARGSQQIISGTRKLHDTLLNTKYNKNNHRRVQELYKEIAQSC